MTDKAYAYMDWAAIEGIVYSEERHPKEIMGPRKVKDGILYQCFFPGAASVSLLDRKNGKSHEMTLEDEAGYFACVLSGKQPVPHDFLVDGETKGDPYAFECILSPGEISRHEAGISDRSYAVLGAHVTEQDGVSGTAFALWAPNAIRVSVVGPFCRWDGRQYPMEFHEESGIYELFIPYISYGTEYLYELKLSTGLVYTRPDPYAFSYGYTGRPVSYVTDLSYKWKDGKHMASVASGADRLREPLAVYECSLAAWKARSKDPENETYLTLAESIGSFVKDMGYTHIELNPVMEYVDDASGGFQTTGFFAPTSRFGTPAEFKGFIDRMHADGIGVILDWTPAWFSPDTGWLAFFDGTCLYEHLDPRQGIHPLWGTRLFNHGRPEVRSFLFSNACFWMREYHADGLRLDGCSTMLRLDYARGDQWVANIYGSSENLEGVEFLSRLSGIFSRSFPGGILIMTEDVDWPDVTAPAEEDGLGFTYKWNLHFTQDMLNYFGLDSEGRRREHAVLTNGMLQNYFEHSIISLSRGIGSFDRRRFADRFDGKDKARAALMRAAYGYLFLHPGKKLLSDREVFNKPYQQALLSLYRSEPALYLHDYEESGFEWINTMDSEHSVLTFLRKGDTPGETLLVVCNFSDENFDQYQVGVPYAGSYKEILNSDHTDFGGSGKINPRARLSRDEAYDERPQSLRLRIAPRSAAVFKYQTK